ncbi:uracil-DNA glycosylase [Halostella sp. JP-L12]|uniref:uracil-DNA glycosylase family protein n=1 Tax=Halostella TaxID=1843185 RepID=UPI000EF7A1D6|nr:MULTISPECIES: uracil-DNA glycosylase family protein [Halostella]NHN49756.1 uracil-DNA glycosylase [Halostella sp. JP-L12]
MENVTDRTRNPFGMSPPCETPCSADHDAVHGYGDANADFHAIGDHPGAHGGRSTGVPFTGTDGARRIQSALHEVGLLADPYADEPTAENLFCSYLHTCCAPEGETPDRESYARLERFFDAEFRAINAHVLLPVGERATAHVLQEHTAQAHKLELDMPSLHATEVRGRGYLVVPVRDPEEWTDTDRERLVGRLNAILDSDYRQESDLGRFLPGDEPYRVR